MRYRVRWGKEGKLRFLSHHDVATVLERSMRRASLPLAYSKGFSAHPKIAFGSGLPVGYGSDVELLDLELDEDVDPGEMCERLRGALPGGLAVHSAERLMSKGVSLGGQIVAAEYESRCEADWLPGAIETFLGLPSYDFERPYKGAMRTDDIRAGVLAMEARPGGLWLRCSIQPRATRPGDVMKVLAAVAGAELPPSEVQRTDLLGEGDDGLVSLVHEPVGAAR